MSATTTRFLWIVLLFGLGGACGGGDGRDEEEHAEDEEHVEAPRTDAHHVEEARPDCTDDVELSPEAVERYGIEIEPVREIALVPTISAPGHLAFPQGAVARVGSPVAGRVVELRVRSGDAVEAGQTLLVLESSALGEAQADYLQRRAIAAAAGPSAERAREGLERARELFASVQGIALEEVRRRESELGDAERDVSVARAFETAARDRLRMLGMHESAIGALEESGRAEPRIAVSAPIAGRIVEVAVTLGELVDPEEDRLLVVGDPRTLWAIAEVSETRLAEVALGAPARVEVGALGSSTFTGKVSAIAPVLEASTRTAEVRIEVANPEGALLPGMFIQVEIDSSRGAGAPVLAVPDGAVLDVEGRPSVFVPVEPGSGLFCKHEVEVGAPVGTRIPVLAGLRAGELVVVAGTFRLKAEHGKASAEHEH